MPEEIPRKLFYKIGEVCQLTDTQPYVLRFWESEFPQLAPTKSRSGQRLYRKRDIDLVLTIKQLLHDEGYTIAGARKKLGMTDSQRTIEDLLDRPVAPGPSPQGATVQSATAELKEIIRMMDDTDRRLTPERRKEQ